MSTILFCALIALVFALAAAPLVLIWAIWSLLATARELREVIATADEIARRAIGETER